MRTSFAAASFSLTNFKRSNRRLLYFYQTATTMILRSSTQYEEYCMDVSKASTASGSVWEHERSHARRRRNNKGSIPIDANMTDSEQFALECLLGESVSDIPKHAQIDKGNRDGFTEPEQFALDCLMTSKPTRQRRSNWLKKCWRSVRPAHGKRETATAA